MRKTKLELTWIGKDKRPKLEPRILLEDPSKSYHASQKVTENDIFDNKLIFGDNLLALKALEQEYTGKVKCVFIDPPYNTGNAFTHYDDGLEHSIWLSLMRDRLMIIRSLLAEDGSIWITIDDSESHYLKVLCDEVFGRNNFISNVVWQKKYAPANDALWLSDDHDHVLVYAKSKEIWRPNKLPRTEEQNKQYKNPDNDHRGPWMSDNYTCAKSADERPNLFYKITNPNTKEEILPKRSRVWAFGQEAHQKHIEDNLIWWGKDGSNSTPRFKKFLHTISHKGRVPNTVWVHSEVGHNQDAKREIMALDVGSLFDTPKPEKLLERIIHLATNTDDLILDSFSGSGTTGAVAHKMGRRWIMVELGEHCHTHIAPRLQKVIDGEDQGGISKSVNWQGGGGFRYYSLAPSLLQKDQWDNWIINKEYNAEMLAEAVCKLEGFTYEPSDVDWWNHGYSTETDFLFVTTQNLSVEKLEQLSEDVGSDRSLLVMCGAFRCKPDRFANLTIKKMPKAVMKHCEWAHDDYSLNVQNLPMAEREPETQNPEQNDLF